MSDFSIKGSLLGAYETSDPHKTTIPLAPFLTAYAACTSPSMEYSGQNLVQTNENKR